MDVPLDQRFEWDIAGLVPEINELSDIVLSPHFDDGALSAASVLCAAGPAALLVTVCGGEPDATGDDEWDRQCGFESGPAAARGRAAEDRAAAAVAGNPVLHLPLPDAPYRTAFPLDQIVEAVRQLIRPSVRLWAPVGIGSHPDHVGTRDAAISAARDSGCTLALYADCPYAFITGWDATDETRAAEDRWTPRLAELSGLVDAVRPRVVELDDAAMRAKVAMVRCHASQLAGLGVDLPLLMAWDGPLRREMFWPVGPTGQAGTEPLEES